MRFIEGRFVKTEREEIRKFQKVIDNKIKQVSNGKRRMNGSSRKEKGNNVVHVKQSRIKEKVK